MDKNMLNEFRRLSGQDNINENTNYKEVAQEINNSILKIDENLDVENFALAVGEILKEEYGSHNYKTFKKTLDKVLGSSKDWLDLESHPYEEINENDFIPGVSDSDYGLAANVAIAQLSKELKGSDEEAKKKKIDILYNTILHNKDVVSIINKLEKPEVIHMIEILKENPKELKRLINNI